jgi:hypothetical protein
MISLSSNHFSVDQQTDDVITHLRNGNEAEQAHYRDFIVKFPEYDSLIWCGSWMDPELNEGIDPDYMSWVIDWIEANTSVLWLNDEPVILEEGDSEDDPEDY